MSPLHFIAKPLVDCELSRRVSVRLLIVSFKTTVVQKKSRLDLWYLIQIKIHSVHTINTSKEELSDCFLDLIKKTRHSLFDKMQVY